MAQIRYQPVYYDSVPPPQCGCEAGRTFAAILGTITAVCTLLGAVVEFANKAMPSEQPVTAAAYPSSSAQDTSEYPTAGDLEVSAGVAAGSM